MLIPEPTNKDIVTIVKTISKDHEIAYTARSFAVPPTPSHDAVAYQVIEYKIAKGEMVITGSFDTRITSDKKRFIIGGDGFFPSGSEITGRTGFDELLEWS